ncbi:MAG: DUF2090 domain-containing protein [Candidatus Levybacteria bacterium CG10_big_fil_rev_8_21_14_0_10_35_13]|nr:MAG: DUF2090 domain-containing protein [Candidatus Levybacteria bacterium CG10_big_fil_rev_8_21_14_0_10_35_13]
MDKIGYDKPLYILPFDHRATFATNMFGLNVVEDLNEEQAKLIKEFKLLIYLGFKDAINKGVPKESGAILCEEQFGAAILDDARRSGYITILTTEKSGSSEFKFQYEKDFRWHIDKFKPTFTKVLLRYNPSDSADLKQRQKTNLKLLSDFSHENGYKFLLEVLVIPTEEQLMRAGSREAYDENLRPILTKEIIIELQNFGIEPDIWKIEGLDKEEDYREIVNAARSRGRIKVSLVILGRGANEEKVEQWLSLGAKVKGIVGFAVGRTAFWDSLEKYYKKEIGQQEVINSVSGSFKKYCKIFSPNLNLV